MEQASASLIEYLPCFFDYCRKRGLSLSTQKNYQRYLNKFILWLKINNKIHLLPNELTLEDIASYTAYLKGCQKKNDKNHDVKTRNYYLIALRALLGYFEEKNIESIRFNKITLNRTFKRQKAVKPLGLSLIKSILSLPPLDSEIGILKRADSANINFSDAKLFYPNI